MDASKTFASQRQHAWPVQDEDGVYDLTLGGSEQTKDAMWDRIEEKFFTAMKKDGSYRTRDQLTSKWSHINRKVRKLIAVYEECSHSRRSGTNDTDVLRLATARYQDDGHQGKVPIDLWRILSRSPKWKQLNNLDGGSFWKRSSVDAEVEVDETIGSTDQIPPFNVADSDDKDLIPRPIGRKKAKSIASGSGGSGSVSVSSRDEIGREMGAFVEGRELVHNVLLCQELARGYNRKNISPRCLMKLDLQKAYDNMSCKAIIQILTLLKFPSNFINWIKYCVTTTSYSIHFAGENFGYFRGGKGIRQGDPISPLLFVIIMEYLSRAFLWFASKEHFGYHPMCKSLKLINIIFADDLIVACKADIKSITCIMRALQHFRDTTGLNINQGKSEIIFGGIKPQEEIELLQLTKVRKGQLPFTYLGGPITSSRISAKDCERLIEKMTTKITAWTSKNLSYAGKCKLINSVLYELAFSSDTLVEPVPSQIEHSSFPDECGLGLLPELFCDGDPLETREPLPDLVGIGFLARYSSAYLDDTVGFLRDILFIDCSTPVLRLCKDFPRVPEVPSPALFFLKSLLIFFTIGSSTCISISVSSSKSGIPSLVLTSAESGLQLADPYAWLP
ncbi:unnamed protein product [Cuscuta campestris]|uniref:Reverse transcriptase domain-containing protein n=1 Tax=Cuscuta campestris TaxID=132261 RepID=A0A484K4S3_9ASTE|nr:unnamed protein product [Cuscuta campestris]